MKILRYEKNSGWVTKIIYREQLRDLVIQQYRKGHKQEDFRQIYLFDEDNSVPEQLYLFLKGIVKNDKRRK